MKAGAPLRRLFAQPEQGPFRFSKEAGQACDEPGCAAIVGQVPGKYLVKSAMLQSAPDCLVQLCLPEGGHGRRLLLLDCGHHSSQGA